MEFKDAGSMLIDNFGGKWLVITEFVGGEGSGLVYRAVGLAGGFLSEASGHTLEELIEDIWQYEEVKILYKDILEIE